MINIGDILRIRNPKHHFAKTFSEYVTYAFDHKKIVGVFMFLGAEPIDAPGTVTGDATLQSGGWRHLEDFARGTVKVTAKFETQSGDLTGSEDVPVKRVEVQDDGTITVVIDYWPTK